MHRRVATSIVFCCLGICSLARATDPHDARRTTTFRPVGYRESSGGFTDKSGWYAFDERNQLLLTPSARGGWFVADLENLRAGRIEQRGADHYVWRPAPGRDFQAIRFVQDKLGQTTGFVWHDQDGNEHTASKQPAAGHVEEVFFENGSLQLSGLLLTPVAETPTPAVVMIHGSGASDRDNVWYQAIASHLVTKGIAVLLPDKRGTGKSQGDWQVASFEDFARDALAAAELLKQQTDVDARRIGLLGISQGGWIAPLAAGLATDVAFVVNVSGSAVRPNEQLLHELQQTSIQRGREPAQAAQVAPTMAAIARSRRPIWWKKNGDFDPIPHWQSLPCPGLIVYGKNDENDNVPVTESTKRLERIIASAKLERLTVQVYPDAGHGLKDPNTGRIRQDFLNDLSRWIADPSCGTRNR